MIVSYCWTQDADRLGALTQNGVPDPLLIDIAIRDLAAVHGVEESRLRALFDPEKDVFAWDWRSYDKSMGTRPHPISRVFTEEMAGSCAGFGPGQFADQVFAQIRQPAANCKLFIAGEATSSCHAWDLLFNRLFKGLTSLFVLLVGLRVLWTVHIALLTSTSPLTGSTK